ncbi:hypothetical protein EMMF5_003411 [Cystobasidiomycetes sp. EMM_F5]
MTTLSIDDIFVREPIQRPSHAGSLAKTKTKSKDISLTSAGHDENALERFQREERILKQQLQETEALYQSLLEIRSKRNKGVKTFQQQTELDEGVYVNTEISTDTDAFVISLGFDAYVEMELHEAIAYCQRREEYLRVALARIKDRLSGLTAEQKMDAQAMVELLQQLHSRTGI